MTGEILSTYLKKKFVKKFNDKGAEALAEVPQRLENPCPWQPLLGAEQGAEQFDFILILALLQAAVWAG